MPLTSIVGFDSAWTDLPKNPGAVCAIRIDAAGHRSFVEPQLASFTMALDFIDRQKTAGSRCLVALDQPTIVPNIAGLRPVDRIAASLISWLGGGVQPANRSKRGMFDDAAPIWLFKERLDAIEDPEQARWAEAGLFLIEVFPALALTTLASSHFGRLLGPRYNPARRKTFRQLDWISVADAVARHAAAEQIVGMEEWAARAKSSAKPRKSDHDMLDSVLCALIGYWWLFKPPANGPA